MSSGLLDPLLISRDNHLTSRIFVLWVLTQTSSIMSSKRWECTYTKGRASSHDSFRTRTAGMFMQRPIRESVCPFEDPMIRNVFIERRHRNTVFCYQHVHPYTPYQGGH